MEVGRKWRKETTIRSSGITNIVAISQPHNVLALLIMVSVLRILLLIMLDTVYYKDLTHRRAS